MAQSYPRHAAASLAHHAGARLSIVMPADAGIHPARLRKPPDGFPFPK